MPLHKQVADHLRKEIATRFQPGEKLEAESKLAARFDVSTRTIREAIGALAYEGLVERRQGSGTRVINQTSRQHVAVILGVGATLPRQGFHALRIVEQLSLLLGDQGYPAHTYWANHDKEGRMVAACLTDFEQSLRQQRICGIVVVKGPLDSNWCETIRKSGVPLVGRITEYREAASRSHLIREGVGRLIAGGRRKIALMEYLDPLDDQDWNDRCRNAFLNALNQYGAQTRPYWMRGDLHPSLVGAGYDEFKEIWMAAPEKPDGLLVCDDHLYRDASLAILELGIQVPEQLQVVTHANKGSGIVYPFPTARMEFDPDEVARILADILIRLMKGEAVEARPFSVKFKWVEKEVVTSEQSPVTSEQNFA